MNAMSVIMSMLVDEAKTPYTSSTGGSSSGRADAGQSDSSKYQYLRDITTADRVGAGILTALILGGLVAALVLMNIE